MPSGFTLLGVASISKKKKKRRTTGKGRGEKPQGTSGHVQQVWSFRQGREGKELVIKGGSPGERVNENTREEPKVSGNLMLK